MGDALRQPGGGSLGGMPLLALVLGWGQDQGEGCIGLTFYLTYFFPVKPQVCNAGVNSSNPNFIILCKIIFVFLVNVNTVNSILRPVVNVIVLCKGPSEPVTKLKIKKVRSQ